MSWSVQKNIIADVLDDLGYRQVKFNITVEQAPENFANKVYEFKFETPELNDASSGTVIKSLAGIIRVGYIAESINDYDAMIDDFQIFINTVAVNSNSFINDPTLTQIDEAENYYVGEMSVFIGIENVC
jgi:hypothetical protein